jgi:hypothetical protein
MGANLPEVADDGNRRLFSGGNDAIVADLRAFRDLGVGHIDFNFEGADAARMIAAMQRFHGDVLAKV